MNSAAVSVSAAVGVLHQQPRAGLNHAGTPPLNASPSQCEQVRQPPTPAAVGVLHQQPRAGQNHTSTYTYSKHYKIVSSAMASARSYDITFFTATVLEWKHLLANDEYKNIILGSLSHMVTHRRVMVHAFVIMNNHIHLLWHIRAPHRPDDVKRDLLRFTSQMMIKDLRNNNRELLAEFYVGAADRKHQVWERNPLSVGIWTEGVLRQKLQYIHENPVRAGLCSTAQDYKYSTAGMYHSLPPTYDFVTVIGQ